MKKIKFITPNGIEVEGVVLYTSNLSEVSSPFEDISYDEIVYAQNRLVKLHHIFELDDECIYHEIKYPEVEVICEYIAIPELD